MAKKANQFERIEKHHHDDGYTTYHEDGTTSDTTKDLIGDGYTTRKNGSVTSRSRKRKTLSGDEVIETTYEDGSRSVTVKEKDGSYRTQHSNGTETRTTKDTFGTGYTTSDSYPSSGDLFGQVSPDSAGGDVLLPIMAILGVFSIISLFKIKFAVLLLPLLVASIILRIILTRKYKNGIFFHLR